MPDSFYIKEITDRQDPAIDMVSDLFLEMYDYMNQHGLMIDLADEGQLKWIHSVTKSLGRFGVLLLCYSGDEVTGFAHGSISLTPDYLGNRKVGVITHIHIRDAYRGQGAGEALVKSLEQWFAVNDVHSVELKVLAENHPAIGFWKKLGYYAELHQYRKMKNKL